MVDLFCLIGSLSSNRRLFSEQSKLFPGYIRIHNERMERIDKMKGEGFVDFYDYDGVGHSSGATCGFSHYTVAGEI